MGAEEVDVVQPGDELRGGDELSPSMMASTELHGRSRALQVGRQRQAAQAASDQRHLRAARAATTAAAARRRRSAPAGHRRLPYERGGRGRLAEEQTEVLVWYSPEAIHFGIVASDSQPETIRATVADRDNLDRDDNVTIYLDTFCDRRRAFFFTVNPLGAQQDGVQTEGAGSAGHVMGFNQGDRNPDYQFDSKGTLTPTGYVVEVRIPFKSLRYPGTASRRGASTCSARSSAPATRTRGPTCGAPAPASWARQAPSRGCAT